MSIQVEAIFIQINSIQFMKVLAQIENYTFCCLITAASTSSISTLWPEPMTSRWPGSVSSRGPGHQPQTAREESSSSAGLAGIIIAAGLEGHFPDSKVHGANMGPIWGRQDPGGPHVGSMNLAIWVGSTDSFLSLTLFFFLLIEKIETEVWKVYFVFVTLYKFSGAGDMQLI